MGRPLKIKKSTTIDIGFNDFGNVEVPVIPVGMTSTEFLGVVGGANTNREKSGTYPATYVPTISRPADPLNAGWTGRTGRVESIVQSALSDLGVNASEAIAYLCGNPEMIVAAERELSAYGLPDGAIHKELYWPAGKQPTGATEA